MCVCVCVCVCVCGTSARVVQYHEDAPSCNVSYSMSLRVYLTSSMYPVICAVYVVCVLDMYYYMYVDT